MNKLGARLHRDGWLFRAFCEKFNSIYLYGINKNTESIIAYLNDEGIKIDAIIDGSSTEQLNRYDGLKVLNLDNLEYNKGDAYILCSNEVEHCVDRDILMKKGIPENAIFGQKEFGKEIIYENRFLSRLKLDEGKFFCDNKHLNSLGLKYGTDKAENDHNYLKKYEFFLEKYKKEKIRLMELGVFNGSSIKMWDEYFPMAEIYGVDIDPRCKENDSPKVHIITADLSDEIQYENLKKIRPNIIIDDASHIWSHQIKAIYHLMPALESGGIYILEDLQSSFPLLQGYGYDDSPISAYDLLKEVASAVTSQEHPIPRMIKPECVPFCDIIDNIAQQIEMISFIYGSCIMIKR